MLELIFFFVGRHLMEKSWFLRVVYFQQLTAAGAFHRVCAKAEAVRHMNIVQLRHSSSNQCAGSLALAGDINGKGHEQLENHDTSLIRVIYTRKYAWTLCQYGFTWGHPEMWSFFPTGKQT